MCVCVCVCKLLLLDMKSSLSQNIRLCGLGFRLSGLELCFCSYLFSLML